MCIDLESSIQPAQKDFQYLNKKKKKQNKTWFTMTKDMLLETKISKIQLRAKMKQPTSVPELSPN